MKMTGARKLTIKILSEELEKLMEKLKEMDLLKQKINDLEKVVENMKKGKETDLGNHTFRKNFDCRKCDTSAGSERDLKKHIAEFHKTSINCRMCDKMFIKNSDLELHIELNHKESKKYEYDQCDMTFVLKWRLKKHEQIHVSETIKFCHYFNNQKHCTYKRVGCLFKHPNVSLRKWV